MGRVACTFRWIADGLLWLICSVEVRGQTEGWSWLIGRQARERAFIRRLLTEHPVVAELPRERLNRVADRAVGSLERWRSRAATAGAMAVAAFLATVAWSYLYGFGAPLPRWTRPAAIVATAIGGGECVRRWYIRAEIAGAVAAVYPTLFCTCGYCLMGLPDDAVRCPECGTHRSAPTLNPQQ